MKVNKEDGFAAISAIFLVVILAAFGAFMLNISNTQQITSAKDLMGTRAYLAARAGLEWGLGTGVATACPSGTTTLSVPMQTSTFAVAVTGTSNTYTEGVNTSVICRITSVATVAGAAVGSLGYVERSLSVSMER